MSLVCTEVLNDVSFRITADAIIWVVDVYGVYTSTESEDNSRTSFAECDFLLKEESKI
jgi:isopentenyl phosphate kinase